MALGKTLILQRNVAAYAIFHDRSLADMAHRRPASEAEFAEVYGVGEAKLKTFAEPFLAAIAEFGADGVR